MLGTIIGDIAGSFREFTGKEKFANLPLMPEPSDLPTNTKRYGMTDDSLLSIATASVLLGDLHTIEDFALTYHRFGNVYRDPIGGFGAGFRKWLEQDDLKAYHSCGNGSAMRVSPVGHFAKTVDDVLTLSFNSASPTHNHPEGIKGAQATALSIYLAKSGCNWEYIKSGLVENWLHYEPIEQLDHFDCVCQDTMRLAWHVLDTTDNFHDAVFKAVTIPYADSDTLGAIVGSIAEPLYGIPKHLKEKAMSMIPDDNLKNIVTEFMIKYTPKTYGTVYDHL